MMNKLASDVKLFELPRHVLPDGEGEIFVFEQRSGLPFIVSCVFTVRGMIQNAVRGQHVHRECSQVYMYSSGAIEVECDDGRAKQIFQFDRPGQALFVPASIWSTQIYRTDGSMLTALCHEPYDEADYIREYAEFLAWRQEPSVR